MCHHQILISFCNIPIPNKFANILVNYQIDLGIKYQIPVHLGFGKLIKSSTGMTMGDGKIYILFTRWGKTYLSVLKQEDFSPIRYYELPEINDPHSILFFDSSLFIVSTGTDQVIRYRLSNGSTPMNPEVIYAASSQYSDTHHINSIIDFNGDVYISAFGPKSGKKWTSARNGYIYNLSKGEIVRDNIYHPHTLSSKDGEIYYCESRTGIFHSLGEGGLYKFDGYIRGVAWLSNDFVFIGSSNRGKNNFFRKLLTRIMKRDYIHGFSKLYLFNTQSKQIIDSIDLSSTGPEIYDLLNIS